MHQGSHSNQTLSGCMYHRFGTMMVSDVISSRESTNTLKLVRIGFNEVYTGVEWRSEVTPDLSMFSCRLLGWAGWVTSAGELDCAVQLDNSQF